MHIVIFTHPHFLNHQSMPRYASMVGEGMKQRGHEVTYWTAKPFFFKIPASETVRKWLSYIDQYVLFPMLIRYRIRKNARDTLYVFADHALGPWVPVVADRPHVIHCHDFLAQFSAEGKIAENSVGWSGKQLQMLIRKGFSKGRHFISVSEKTRNDLHELLNEYHPQTSKMIHNGLNPLFKPHSHRNARLRLKEHISVDLRDGYLLHVGGNQWYKNRAGVIEIYNSWRCLTDDPKPLLLLGHKPDKLLMNCFLASPFRKDIHFISGLSDELVHLAYAGADLLLFPSYSEGFGWPVIEAMASGCMVLTTDDETLRAVCAEAAFFIPVRPPDPEQKTAWARAAAKQVESILVLPESEKSQMVARGISNAARFNVESKLNEIEETYRHILENQSP